MFSCSIGANANWAGATITFACWQLVNGVLHVAVVKCTQRAVGARYLGLGLFPLFLVGDLFFNLVFLDTSLNDPFFWGALVLEVAAKVARESGAFLDLSSCLERKGCGRAGQAVLRATTGPALPVATFKESLNAQPQRPSPGVSASGDRSSVSAADDDEEEKDDDDGGGSGPGRVLVHGEKSFACRHGGIGASLRASTFDVEKTARGCASTTWTTPARPLRR